MEESRRKYLIDMLEILLGDDFILSELTYLTDDEIVDKIISVAFYYKSNSSV